MRYRLLGGRSRIGSRRHHPVADLYNPPVRTHDGPTVKGLILRLALSLAVAVVAAYLSVDYLVSRPRKPITVGPWFTSLTAGSAGAGPYQRAWIARHGIWALEASEVIYYNAVTDSRGFRLSHDAVYRIEGTDPDTRWWSIAAYNDDHLIPNPFDRYSFSRSTVERDLGGSWVIRLAREEVSGNWLPSGERPGDLVLTLRCYNPSPRMLADPGGVLLPEIIREPGP